MATIKSFTSLEQSKKLAEILPIESADMAWYPSYAQEGYSIRMLNDTYPLDIIGEEHDEIPAWSLAALLELTPNDVSLLHLEDVYQAVYDVKPYHITNRFDNPLDAAFEMICWLKENNEL